MKTSQPYKLSFSTGGLFLREASFAVPLYLELHEWHLVQERIKEINLFQTRTLSSGVRVSQEVISRLSMLSNEELKVVNESNSQDQAHLMWIAACRRYGLIGKFAEEVVREKFLLLKPELTYLDFDSFLRSKALWHHEIDKLKESTTKKLRQNVFKMLREAGLLSDNSFILHASLSHEVAKLITSRDVNEFRLFALSDTDIERMSE